MKNGAVILILLAAWYITRNNLNATNSYQVIFPDGTIMRIPSNQPMPYSTDHGGQSVMYLPGVNA